MPNNRRPTHHVCGQLIGNSGNKRGERHFVNKIPSNINYIPCSEPVVCVEDEIPKIEEQENIPINKEVEK